MQTTQPDYTKQKLDILMEVVVVNRKIIEALGAIGPTLTINGDGFQVHGNITLGPGGTLNCGTVSQDQKSVKIKK